MPKLILLLFSFIWMGLAHAQGLPAPQGWVNDFAEVLDNEQKAKISAIINEIENKTSAEIIVVTRESIAPFDEIEYARKLFDTWKPGKKGKDNGILLLLAVKERRWRIETGYGMEGILPDGLCGEIGRKYMVPYFKNQEYSQGLYYGVTAIAQVIAKNANINLTYAENIGDPAKSSEPPVFLYLFAFFFFFIWNLPWPVFIGLPFTLIFALAFLKTSLLASALTMLGYICSMLFRYLYWSKLPIEERKSLWNTQTYGGYGGYRGRGFGSQGFSRTGGGFGGGSSGGGGAGGGF